MDEMIELKRMIDEYLEARADLEDMYNRWADYGDPTCDPGILFEYEERLDKMYNLIVMFMRTQF